MMSAIAQSCILSEDELIERQTKLEGEFPQATPIEILTKLSEQYLAALFPEYAQSLLAGDQHKITQGFAHDLLHANGMSNATSMWTPEERQRQIYGGSQALLFAKADDDLIAFYKGKLAPADRNFNPDPLTWDAAEF